MSDETRSPGFEVSHGKPRLARPRMSDVTDGAAGDRLHGRDEKGRFGSGNRAATGKGWKAALVRQLPDTPGAKKLYAGAVRELVHDTPFARAACLRFVLATLRAAELHAAATKAGIESDVGRELVGMQREMSDTAARESTAALTYTKRKTPSAKEPTNGLEALRAQVHGAAAKSDDGGGA